MIGSFCKIASVFSLLVFVHQSYSSRCRAALAIEGGQVVFASEPFTLRDVPSFIKGMAYEILERPLASGEMEAV